jgi:hypothetical protein
MNLSQRIDWRSFQLNSVPRGIFEVDRKTVAARAFMHTFLNYFHAMIGQMATKSLFIVFSNCDTQVIEVSAARDLRNHPSSSTRACVNEVNQRSAGAKLHHRKFRKLALNIAPENVTVELYCLMHSANYEQDVVNTFQSKWWSSRTRHGTTSYRRADVESNVSRRVPTAADAAVFARKGDV